ncbi:MAG: 4-hydroxybenzoate solanesyltransferase [Prochlorotrichaceae cyanobacterium]
MEPKWKTIVRLLRWDKPAGRLILMIPALWSVFLAAQGQPHPILVLIIICGSFATSAAGCIINDLWDRNIDNQVERTRTRPLAERSLSVQVGIIVLLISLLCAAGLVIYLNRLSFILAVVALPFIALYPGAKRVFPIPQLVLSLAWGFAVLISWAAVTGSLEPITWLLWGAVLNWTMAFDTIYALADRDDDRRIGIHSSAIFFGDRAPLAIGVFFLLTIAFLAGLGFLLNLRPSYWLTLILVSLLWLWQFLWLRNPLPRATYGKFFSQNVLAGFVLLAGMIAGIQP